MSPQSPIGVGGNPRETRAGAGLSLLFSCLCFSLCPALSVDCLRVDGAWMQAAPGSYIFSLCLLSTSPSPNSSFKNPREALRLTQVGIIFVGQRVRGSYQPSSGSCIHLLE